MQRLTDADIAAYREAANGPGHISFTPSKLRALLTGLKEARAALELRNTALERIVTESTDYKAKAIAKMAVQGLVASEYVGAAATEPEGKGNG